MGDFERVSVGIVGASGYGGVQLVRLLLDHPNVDIVYLGGQGSAGKPFSDIYPHLEHRFKLQVEPVEVDRIAERCQVVFLSLPNGLAGLWLALLEKGCKVLDLSADYRFLISIPIRLGMGRSHGRGHRGFGGLRTPGTVPRSH